MDGLKLILIPDYNIPCIFEVTDRLIINDIFVCVAYQSVSKPVLIRM